MSLLNIHHSGIKPIQTRSKTQGRVSVAQSKLSLRQSLPKIQNTEDKDNFDNTLISNRSEIYELIHNKKQELPLEEFKRYTNDLLLNYKFKKHRDDDHDESETDMVLLEDMERRKHMYRLKKSPLGKEKKTIKKKLDENSRLHVTTGLSDMSILKVKVQKPTFKDPYESLETIKENQKIYQEINSSLQDRKQFFSDRNMGRVMEIKDHKIRMPKIKITNIMKVNYDLLKQELEEEEAKKKQQESMTKKINVELYDLSNPACTDKELPRIHCSYIYSKKNFPEGREQFSMSYNNVDFVLYGGLSINRNANVWTLNTGMYNSY
jgi:hypothetical protein